MAELAASVSDVKSPSTTAALVYTPHVVRFGYMNFQSEGGKWYATCTSCNEELIGITTSFTK